MNKYESGFRAKNLFFSVERVEFEMAVLKQRKIDGERRVFQDEETHQYFFIAHKRNSCDLICSETSSSTEPSTVSAPSLNSFKSRIYELWLRYSCVQNDCFPVRTN